MKKSDKFEIIRLKKRIKDAAHSMMLRDMVFDNIKDLIPEYLELRIPEYSTCLIKAEFKNRDVTADVFETTVTKLSKKFRKKPYISVNTSELEASWWFSPHNIESIMIVLRTGNSEKCDVITVKHEVEEYELTGYCKQLKEKEYFNN